MQGRNASPGDIVMSFDFGASWLPGIHLSLSSKLAHQSPKEYLS